MGRKASATVLLIANPPAIAFEGCMEKKPEQNGSIKWINTT